MNKRILAKIQNYLYKNNPNLEEITFVENDSKSKFLLYTKFNSKELILKYETFDDFILTNIKQLKSNLLFLEGILQEIEKGKK